MIVAQANWTGIAPPDMRWSAIDDDIYDGAPDSRTRNLIGYGRTQAEAIADLRRLMDEWMNEHPREDTP